MTFFNIQDDGPSRSRSAKHDCSACGLHLKCNSPKMGLTGEGKKGILIIAEAPGKTEDMRGEQLVGEAGRFLENRLHDLGIDLHKDCWKINAVNCRPFTVSMGKEHNKTPNVKQINCCRHMWQEAVEELKPTKIFLLGKIALQSFLNDRMNNIGVLEKWVGAAIPDQDYKTWVYPMYHPSFLIRNQKDEALHLLFEDQLETAVEHDKPFINYSENVHIIKDLKEAIGYLEELRQLEPEWLSFDYESTGLKPFRKGHKLWTIAFSISRNTATAMPFYDDWRFVDLIEEVLTCKHIKKSCHNINFEQRWTKQLLGYDIYPRSFDTMVAAHVLDNIPKTTGLKTQCYLKYGRVPYDDDVKKFLSTSKPGEDEKSDHRFNIIDKAPLDKLLEYNGLDAMFGYRLTIDQSRRLTEHGMDDPYDFFHDGILAISRVVEHGMRADEDYLREVSEDLADELEQIEEEIQQTEEHKEWEKAEGKPLDILSSHQVKKLVTNVLHIKTDKKTDSGQQSVDKEVLAELAKKNPFFDKILRYRKTHKTKGTYIDGILRESINGVINQNINLHTAVTYRPSTDSPNLANIPKRDKEVMKLVRKGIIPSKGRQLFAVDYSGVEVCSGCFYHKDPVLISYVTNPKNDMHRDQAMALFKLGKDQVTPEIRYEAKNGFVFPQFYGDYWGSNCRQLWPASFKHETKDGILLNDHLFDVGIETLEDFQEHVKQEEDIFWNKKFKVFTEWKDQAWEEYLEKGYIQYLTGFRVSGKLDRKNVVNYPFQGTAFHLLLWGLIELDFYLEEQGFETRICNQIYDEMMLDMVPEEKEDLLPVIRSIMTEAIREEFDWINVPLDVDAKISEIDGNWAEMKDQPI